MKGRTIKSHFNFTLFVEGGETPNYIKNNIRLLEQNDVLKIVWQIF